MHNYYERRTFKIYCSFVFGQANFQWSAWGTCTLASKSEIGGPPLLSCLLGLTRGSPLFHVVWSLLSVLKIAILMLV